MGPVLNAGGVCLFAGAATGVVGGGRTQNKGGEAGLSPGFLFLNTSGPKRQPACRPAARAPRPRGHGALVNNK